MKIEGKWWITLYGSDGKIKDQRHGKNVITEDGTSFLAAFLASAAAAASTFTMQYIAIGTDTTAEASSNTALGAELDRAICTVSNVTGSIYRLTASFLCGATSAGDITEYGVFDSTTGGTMFSRDVESAIAKTATDDMVAITEITIS